MAFKENLKKRIIYSSLEKRKKQHPFDAEAAETFTLPADADANQNNSYYFSCHDFLGNSMLFRLGYRGGGGREVWFAWKDEKGNAWVNAVQLDAGEGQEADVKCLKVGEEWEFSFSGKVLQTMKKGKETGDTAAESDASFTGVFTAGAPIFEFSLHMDTEPLAAALAKEKWDKNFKAELTENHQSHYEQVGAVTGTLNLGGKTIAVDMPAVRDHSYGKRDWSYMARHIWLMAILSDGRALNVSMVRYPVVREIVSGYMVGGGKTVCVHSATPIDEMPATGGVPDAFTADATLSDGRRITLKCEKETVYAFPFANGAYTIYEGVGSFEADGAKGRGILEFGYNADPERW